ncbi:unnamed protein product [Malus baccata var. baccata]
MKLHKHMDTSCAMVESLHKMHDIETSNVRFSNVCSLLNAKMAKGTLVHKHGQKMERIFQDLESLRTSIDGKMAQDFFLASISDNFTKFIVNYKVNRFDHTFTEMIDMCCKFEQGFKRDSGSENAITRKRLHKKKAIKSKGTCFHCGKDERWKKKYMVRITSLMTRTLEGTISVIESAFRVSSNSWIFDSGASQHICNSLQGLTGSRTLRNGEMIVRVGNGTKISAKAIGTYMLKLPSGEVVELKNWKMTKSPFTEKGERATEILGLIHTDVCGPMSTTSRGGFSYYITFTDDHSWFGYVYLMKYKSESFERFKEFKNEVEKQTGKQIKILRLDRGGEYLSSEFLDYLKECGIISQWTTPGTPQLHGVSERRNRTLMNMVRSIMSDNDTKGDPRDYVEVMSDIDSKRWQEAMKSEMDSMYQNQVWTLVDSPEGIVHVGNKWVFKRKIGADGNVETYKARLVANGYKQREGIEYEETFSPVAMVKSIRILLAIVAYHDYEIWQMDVKTAFLNGYLEEELYMTQPEGFASKSEKSKSMRPKTPEEIRQMSVIPYASAIGSLMYAMICTRLDIAYAVSITSRYQSNPGLEHWAAVKTVLKYLRRTKDMFLIYGGATELRVEAYTDADFQFDVDDRNSNFEYVFTLNGGAVSCKSKKQDVIADSTTEVEYVAAAEAGKEAFWMKKFITELGVVPTITSPVTLYCDNSGAIDQAKEPRAHQKNKHFDRRFNIIRKYAA